MHAKRTTHPTGSLIVFALAICLALIAPTTASAMQSKAANFNTDFTITGHAAQDMLAVAKAQEGSSQGKLGYTEGWCADFVSDCAKLVGQSAAIPFNGPVEGLYEDVIAAGGTVVKTPQPGDLVFFNYDHVGIMTDADNCISGNMGDPSKVAVCKCSWVIPGAKIVYVRPAYTSGAYLVVFKANGGTGKMAKQTIQRGKAKALRANAFTRTGYLFAGWNTKADGSGTAYADQQKVKNIAKPGKTVKLYAQWKKAPYTVSFKANGGKGKMSAQKIKCGKTTALKANTFTRKGYKFVGWNTKKNGKGKAYKNKQAVKNLAKAGKTIKLYAQWKKR